MGRPGALQKFRRVLSSALLVATRLVLVWVILWVAGDLFRLWAHRAVVKPRMSALGEAVCAAMASGDIERFVIQRPIPEAEPFLHEYQSDIRIAETLRKYRQDGGFSTDCVSTVIEGRATCRGLEEEPAKDWSPFLDLRGILKPFVVTILARRLPESWMPVASRYRWFGYEYTVAVESGSYGFVLEFYTIPLLAWFFGTSNYWMGLDTPSDSKELHRLDRCPASERLFTARMKAGRTAPQYR